MAKIYCADSACAFNGEDGVCTAETVALSRNSIMTVWEGRREFNTCRTKQVSEETKSPEKRMRGAFGKIVEDEIDEGH